MTVHLDHLINGRVVWAAISLFLFACGQSTESKGEADARGEDSAETRYYLRGSAVFTIFHDIEVQVNGKPFVTYSAPDKKNSTMKGSEQSPKQFVPVEGKNEIVVRWTGNNIKQRYSVNFQLLLTIDNQDSKEDIVLLPHREYADVAFAEDRIGFDLRSNRPLKIMNHFQEWASPKKKQLLSDSITVLSPSPGVSDPVSEQIKKWYSTGQIMLEEKREKDKVVSGKYFNLRGEQTAEVKNGTGVCQKYYDNGQLIFSCPMVNSAWNGKLVNYWPSGQIQGIREYLNDKTHGQWTEYYEDGKVSVDGMYNQGTKEGKWVSYEEDGKLKYLVTYKNGKCLNFAVEDEGKEDGEFVTYHDNGKVHIKGRYEYGTKEGEWTEYDETGNILAVARFSMGYRMTNYPPDFAEMD